MVQNHKPDYKFLADVMSAAGTDATETAIQQRFEKQFRERVTRRQRAHDEVQCE
jgi:hypothetical protein